MQRATLSKEDPWDKPLRLSDPAQLTKARDRRNPASEQQSIPKCPLPLLRPTRRSIREGDVMAMEKFAASSPRKAQQQQIAPRRASDSSTKKQMYQTIDKKFRRSTQAFYSNARSASVSPSPKRIAHVRKSLPLNIQLQLPKLSPDSEGSAIPRTRSTPGNSKDKVAQTRLLVDAHRRRGTKQLEKQQSISEKPQVTSPVPSRRVGAFTNVEKCLKDQQRRETDSIPQHVNVSPQTPNVIVDDDITTFSGSSSLQYSPPVPLNRTMNHGYWAAEPQRDEPPTTPKRGGDDVTSLPPRSSSDGSSVVPSALDKSSLKEMAARHRSSIYASLTSRAKLEGSSRSVGTSSSSGSSSYDSTMDHSGVLDHSSGRMDFSSGHSGGGRARMDSSSGRMTDFSGSRSRMDCSSGRMTDGSGRLSHCRRSQSAMVTPPGSPLSDSRSRDMAARRRTTTPPSPAPLVEICPGLSVPLRGSDETLRAVAKDFYTSIMCFGCDSTIHCIADVQYTICPTCRVISPVEEKTFDGEPLTVRWGLGLGFTEENLWTMEDELARSRGSY